MKIEDICREVEELSSLVASWRQGGQPTMIEQDIVLSKLARVYENVKLMDLNSDGDYVAIQNEEVEEAAADAVDDSIFAINMDGISLVSTESESLPADSIVAEPELVAETLEDEILEEEFVQENDAPEVMPEIEDESEQKAETEMVEEEPVHSTSNNNMLFDIDIVPKQSRSSRRSVLMSLYDDDATIEAPAPTVSPVVQAERVIAKEEAVTEIEEPKIEEPKVEVVQVTEEQPEQPEQVAEPIVMDVAIPVNETPSLGAQDNHVKTVAESLSSGVETVADRYVADVSRDRIEDKFACRSFSDLGINERYLLSRDLFGDDPNLCREVLDTLSAFDNYEDAMIYIAENFNWSGECDGARLLLSILEYKFNIR